MASILLTNIYQFELKTRPADILPRRYECCRTILPPSGPVPSHGTASRQVAIVINWVSARGGFRVQLAL